MEFIKYIWTITAIDGESKAAVLLERFVCEGAAAQARADATAERFATMHGVKDFEIILHREGIVRVKVN